jgi:hypothetical protein
MSFCCGTTSIHLYLPWYDFLIIDMYNDIAESTSEIWQLVFFPVEWIIYIINEKKKGKKNEM